MSFIQVFSQFLEIEFPRWGVCQLSFDPQQRALYLHSQTPGRRDAILQDASRLARLDVGIEMFIILHPAFPTVTIDCTPRKAY
jgi:hypothetical protein